MCGIFGQNAPISGFQFHTLNASLNHRGPDDGQMRASNDMSLFHARLAIVDSVGGKQPMERGNLCIVFNGEIYNHLELRKGHNLDCQSRSDTETLLALFEKYGEAMLNLLDGMFAFCIFNKENRKLFLARDRMGEKPMYIYHKGERFAFASELNTLAAFFDLEVNEESLKEFLVKGWVGPVSCKRMGRAKTHRV